MSKPSYRSSVYRGLYAASFVAAYLLLVAYWLSGDDSGSDSSAGVWQMLLGLLIFGAVGAIGGPTLHRLVFRKKSRPGRSASQQRPPSR